MPKPQILDTGGMLEVGIRESCHRFEAYGVVAVLAGNGARHVEIGCRIENEDVIAEASGQRIRPATASQPIVAGTARKGVRKGATP